MDELVEIDEGVYLGTVLLRLRDRYRRVGYFGLHAA